MQRRHVILVVAVLAAVLMVAVLVDPALAAKAKTPGQAGHDFANMVSQFFLPIVIVLTILGMAFDGMRGDWGGVVIKFFLGGLIVGFLTVPGKFQGFMERFVETITG
jgi:hypothetical protein